MLVVGFVTIAVLLGVVAERIARRPTVAVIMLPGSGSTRDDVLDHAAFTLWEIPESPHVGGLSTRPDEYRARVLALLNQAPG